MAAVVFALLCNLTYGRYMIGSDLSMSVFVGAIIGGLIAAALVLMDFMTYHYGRVKDFAIFNLMGIVAAITVYNWNVILHMNTSGWTIRGLVIAALLGTACGNAYAAACGAVKKLSER
jgi:uncharacterized protein (DUF697 family)